MSGPGLVTPDGGLQGKRGVRLKTWGGTNNGRRQTNKGRPKVGLREAGTVGRNIRGKDVEEWKRLIYLGTGRAGGGHITPYALTRQSGVTEDHRLMKEKDSSKSRGNSQRGGDQGTGKGQSHKKAHQKRGREQILQLKKRRKNKQPPSTGQPNSQTKKKTIITLAIEHSGPGPASKKGWGDCGWAHRNIHTPSLWLGQ